MADPLIQPNVNTPYVETMNGTPLHPLVRWMNLVGVRVVQPGMLVLWPSASGTPPSGWVSTGTVTLGATNYELLALV